MRPVKVLTMILAGGVGERLYPLTGPPSKPAVHFGGNFRIIDFTLLNCVLSGIRHVHLLTQYHSFSLSAHRSQRWNILSSGLGEGIEIVPPKMRTSDGLYQGTADAIYRNLELLERHRPDVVLVLSGDHIYRADYDRFIDAHVQKDADISVLTGSVPTEEAHAFGCVRLEDHGRIAEFKEKPSDPSPLAIDDMVPINLGVYCFDTEFLLERLVADSKDPNSAHDFGKNILPTSLELGSVMSCPLAAISPDETPYWRDVGTIDSYFQAHMDLLDSPAAFNLRDKRWPEGSCFEEWLPSLQSVRTEIHGEEVLTRNLIGTAVTLENATVARSVLSRGVHIGEGSNVFEAIVLPGAKIGKNCQLRRVVVEENVEIPDGTIIEAPSSSHEFLVSEKGIVVVSEGYRLKESPKHVRRKAKAEAESVDTKKDAPEAAPRTTTAPEKASRTSRTRRNSRKKVKS